MSVSCTHCEATQIQFSDRVARGDVDRYRRKGPDKTTRDLLEAVGKQGVPCASLLDIGGGIGVIPIELLESGLESATLVEAASAYVEVARAEWERRGIAERLQLEHGNFVELAPQLGGADLVTLDRVICCYDDFERLVTTSAAKCVKLYAFSVPRDRWYVKMVFAIENALRRLTGNRFRAWVHPTSRIEELLAQVGLERRYFSAGLVWQIAVYARSAN